VHKNKVLKLAEDKKYEMYFVDVKFREDSFPTDTIQDKFMISWDRDLSFLIDDPETIQNLKSGWVGDPGEMVGCLYDYLMYLVEDGVIVDEIRINERCKQVITKHGVYNYTDSTLSQVDRSKKIAVAKVEFESLEFGRSFVKEALGIQGIYVPEISDKDWYRYGGSVMVKTKRRNIYKSEAQITRLITEKFPGDPFEVLFLVCNNRFCVFDVYCSEKLAAGMTDLEVYRNWSRFDGRIVLISKTDVEMKALIEKYTR
jgi:hypothetical protein